MDRRGFRDMRPRQTIRRQRAPGGDRGKNRRPFVDLLLPPRIFPPLHRACGGIFFGWNFSDPDSAVVVLGIVLVIVFCGALMFWMD